MSFSEDKVHRKVHTVRVNMKVHRMKGTKWLGGGLRRKGAEELRCAAEVKVNAISRESCVPLNSQEAFVSKRVDYLCPASPENRRPSATGLLLRTHSAGPVSQICIT